MNQMKETIRNSSFGEMHLYFGCRQESVDELYKKEIDEMKSKNVISKCYIGFSRDVKYEKVFFLKLVFSRIILFFNLVIKTLKRNMCKT